MKKENIHFERLPVEDIEIYNPSFTTRSITKETKILSDETQTTQAVSQLLLNMRYTLRIVTRHLSPWVYSHVDVIEQIKKCLLESDKARVDVLIKLPKDVSMSSNEFIRLARKLPSQILLREMLHSSDELPKDLLIVDDLYCVLLDDETRSACLVDNSISYTKRMIELFEQSMQSSTPSIHLRDMLI